MATLGALKARVVSQTVREDLDAGEDYEAELASAISEAINEYASRRFWFNQIATTVSTAASTATVAIPSTVRIIESVHYGKVELLKRAYEEIAHLELTGQPRYWAEDGDNIRLHPIPDAVYSLKIVGVAEIGVPDDDDSSNAWTTEGERLIINQTIANLMRFPFRDADGYAMAAGIVSDELARLQRETAKRRLTPLRSPSASVWTRSFGRRVDGYGNYGDV